MASAMRTRRMEDEVAASAVIRDGGHFEWPTFPLRRCEMLSSLPVCGMIAGGPVSRILSTHCCAERSFL